MTDLTMRGWLKHALPDPVIHTLKGAERYAARLSALWQVTRDIRGQTASDRGIVRRSIAAAPFLMLKDLGRWREPYLLADANIVSRDLGMFGVRQRSDDLAHVMPSNHVALFDAIRKIVKKGDTVIDAGANIGGVSVFLARVVGPTGKIISVEMMPDTAQCLWRNISLNDLHWVTVVESALSDVAGDRVFAQVSAGFFGQATIAATAAGDDSTIRKVEVPTTTIDAIASDLGEIALMKMDLEGAEPLALKGAVRTVPKIRSILFESWNPDGGEVAAILKDHGFAISVIDGRNFLAVQRQTADARKP